MKRYWLMALVGLYMLLIMVFAIIVFHQAHKWSHNLMEPKCVTDMYGGGCNGNAQ